jgi:Protein of unknown function (DUF4232)
MLLAACTSTSGSSVRPAAPSRVSHKVVATYHHCRAHQLRAQFNYGQADQDGLLMSSVTFRNDGTKACFLQGHPDIRPLGKHKSSVPVEGPAFAGLSPANGPRARHIVYPEGSGKRHVVVDVYFQGNNPANPGCRSSKVDYLRVPLSKAGRILVRLPRQHGGIIICNGRFGNDWFHA